MLKSFEARMQDLQEIKKDFLKREQLFKESIPKCEQFVKVNYIQPYVIYKVHDFSNLFR